MLKKNVNRTEEVIEHKNKREFLIKGWVTEDLKERPGTVGLDEGTVTCTRKRAGWGVV